MRYFNLMLKRLMDIFGSTLGILLLLPIMIIIAISIRIDSKGPIIFKQKRLGKNGKIFEIWKFRTMVTDAEFKGLGIRTAQDDPRITKIGKFLRMTSLDELPQLINVFTGKMSLVGPRPPVPYFPYKYEDYNDEMKRRFSFRPGITGYSQIKVRNSAEWNVRIKYDIEYIDQFNIFLDMKIIIVTMLKVFKKENIYRN